MPDLDQWLATCEQMLAEAELLIGRLAPVPAALQPELDEVRRRMDALRDEIERIRGRKGGKKRRKTGPLWTDLLRAPWPPGGGDSTKRLKDR